MVEVITYVALCWLALCTFSALIVLVMVISRRKQKQ